MGADVILSRVERVRKTGRDRWVATCPCHDSKSRQSLAIRELDDGRVLLHDFGGCGVEEILRAVGLDFDALYPERAPGPKPAERKPFSVRDLAHALRFELTVAWIILSSVHAGLPMTEADRIRAGVAVERILAFLGELDYAG